MSRKRTQPRHFIVADVFETADARKTNSVSSTGRVIDSERVEDEQQCSTDSHAVKGVIVLSYHVHVDTMSY
jgi:hypothetical protein